MKKIVKALIASSLVIANLMSGAVFAATSVDFSPKLVELKNLIDECNAKGIATDYEEVNYATIERFEGYIHEDIVYGRTFVDYNIQKIEELYTEAKTNLEGYLNGTIEPYYISRPDMTNLTTDGDEIYDNGTPVYGVGYGHFKTARNDVENFQDFGANMIQMEVGPTDDYSTGYLQRTLENAQNNNVGVSLLLGLHYFPDTCSAEVYNNDAEGFLKYNVNHPEAKAVIENFLRDVLPKVQGYSSLQNICISNEPHFRTSWYYNYYNPLYQQYLETKYGTIDALADAWGKSSLWKIGKSWSSFDMPSGDGAKYPGNTPADGYYDWIEFNDKTFADWHAWVNGIVKEYFPNIPTHSKVMNPFAYYTEDGHLFTEGIDIEMIDAITDYAGNDNWDYIDDPSLYYQAMFLYDFQSSTTGNPVMNSEDHIVRDGEENFIDQQSQHMYNNMWMGAIHGRNLSTVWAWDRTNDGVSGLGTSVLYRPDAIAKIGHASLDLARLSNEVEELRQTSDVAIYYSKPSRLYTSSSEGYQRNASYYTVGAYKQLLNNGIKPGFVSDKNIDKLSNYDYLVIPEVKYCYPETLAAINTFIQNGGKVITHSSALQYDQYKKSLDNSYLMANATKFSSSGDLGSTFVSVYGPRVTLKDTSTGTTPANVDWQYSISNEKVLVNMSNLDYGTTKNIEVYLDGTKLTGMNELLDRKENVSTVAAKGFEPQLVEYNFSGAVVAAEIKDVAVNADTISWNYSGNDYRGANIYKVVGGELEFVAKVGSTSYECEEDGLYVVKAFGRENGESMGKRVYVQDNTALTLAVNSLVYERGYLTVDIKLTNNTNEYASGIVAVEVLNSNGAVNKYAYADIVLAAGSEDGFVLSVPAGADAATLRINTWDTLESKNSCSNTITNALN